MDALDEPAEGEGQTRRLGGGRPPHGAPPLDVHAERRRQDDEPAAGVPAEVEDAADLRAPDRAPARDGLAQLALPPLPGYEHDADLRPTARLRVERLHRSERARPHP